MDNSEIRGIIFLVEYKGRFLLEQRDDNSKLSKWYWVIPGGKKEEDEDTLQTVIREAEKEFGFNLNASDCKKIGIAATHSGRGSNEIWHCPVSRIARPLIVSESAGVGWFTLDEISNMELGYSQSELILPILNEKL